MTARIAALIATLVCVSPTASQARWLNSNTGRFQTMDTYEGDNEEPQTIHKYTYCQNNPANKTDPSGHDALSAAAMIINLNIHFALARLSTPGAGRIEAAADIITLPMSREQAIARYGAYKDGEVKAGNWPDEGKWMVPYNIPDRILNDPDYNWINKAASGNSKTKRIYLNKDIRGMLEFALDELQAGNNLNQLKTFDGCFSQRAARGASTISAHAYGIALDINASENPMGRPGSQPEPLIGAFMSSGFMWGGNFGGGRQDPMHFTLGF